MDGAGSTSGDRGVTSPGEGAPPGARRVLIADDESGIRTALKRFFTRRGWDADEAEDGDAALAKVLAGDYAVVISDMRMPGLSGVHLHDRLAAERPALLERFIFSTGDTTTPDAAAFVRRTQCPVLQKPFELAALARLVDRVVEGR